MIMLTPVKFAIVIGSTAITSATIAVGVTRSLFKLTRKVRRQNGQPMQPGMRTDQQQQTQAAV